jgi:hypothetical protein
MVKKYKALRLVGSVYKIVGYIVLVFSVLSALAVCLSGIFGGPVMNLFTQQLGTTLGSDAQTGMAVVGVVMGIFSLIYGGVVGISLIAAGELVSLLIDMEANTRAAASK